MSDPYECRTLSDVLSVLEGGSFDSDVADQYRALIKAMQQSAEDTGGKHKVKGKITITLDLTLENDAFDLLAQAKTTAPKRVPRRTVMYPTTHGTLSRQHPQQLDAFLRSVDAPPSVRKV